MPGCRPSICRRVGLSTCASRASASGRSARLTPAKGTIGMKPGAVGSSCAADKWQVAMQQDNGQDVGFFYIGN